MPKVHVPIKTIARRLGVHENTVRNWIDRGILRAQRLPTGARRVPAAEVARLEAQMFAAPTSFRDVEFQEAPKSVPEGERERLDSYPTF